MEKTELEAKNEDHRHANAFIFVILSHGDDGYILCRDGDKMHLETLYQQFDGKHCKHLIGKPKIFIVQACRGGKIVLNLA